MYIKFIENRKRGKFTRAAILEGLDRDYVAYVVPAGGPSGPPLGTIFFAPEGDESARGLKRLSSNVVKYIFKEAGVRDKFYLN